MEGGTGQTVRPSLLRESTCRGGSRRMKRICPKTPVLVPFILLVAAVLVLATPGFSSEALGSPAAKGRARPRERSRPLLRPGLRPAPRRPWPVRPPAPSASTAPRTRPPGCCSRLDGHGGLPAGKDLGVRRQGDLGLRRLRRRVHRRRAGPRGGAAPPRRPRRRRPGRRRPRPRSQRRSRPSASRPGASSSPATDSWSAVTTAASWRSAATRWSATSTSSRPTRRSPITSATSTRSTRGRTSSPTGS